jgi:uncharacterized membrane protein YgaE (UPF0421/DUF939 family)
MSEGPRRRIGIALAGILSLLLFFVPLVGPFVQLVTLVFVVLAARRRGLDGWSLTLGAGGALAGLLLHWMTLYVWIV